MEECLVESVKVLQELMPEIVVGLQVGPGEIICQLEGATDGLGSLHGRYAFKTAVHLMGQLILTRDLGALLWGSHKLMCLYGATALFAWAPEARIVLDPALQEWPKGPILLAGHHRDNNRMLDFLLQFLVTPMYKDHRVAVAHHVMGHWYQRPLSRYLFHSYNLANDRDKFEQLHDIVKPSDCTTVFPDVDGAQFPGDYSFYFRKGLFAVSMYLGRPIVDMCIVEPTAANRVTRVQLTLWRPPEPLRPAHATFSEFVRQSAAEIQTFTDQCEADYKRRLRALEAPHLACNDYDTYSICQGRARHKTWARNNKLPYKDVPYRVDHG